MLDCSCPVEMIEITRLDGGESFWVRADDPFWGTGEPCAGGEGDGSAVEAVRPTEDHAERDDDLYDFGQDRGSQVDDEVEYETDAHGLVEIEPTRATEPVMPPRVYETAPAEQTVDARADAPAPDNDSANSDPESGRLPVAILPAAPRVSWLCDDRAWNLQVSLTLPADEPAGPLVAASLVGADAPTWTDLAALPG